ncbi:MAG TPA: flagellar motor switch phosphatase FliY [Syntrophomonas sp.]|nr:flagellar motor switch phosphatase FliY [Syntrophomonas sp.]
MSQEEIDALMGAGVPADQVVKEASLVLSELEIDVLNEIGNINAGAASTALSELLDQKVIIDTPTLSFKTIAELHKMFNRPYLWVNVEFSSGIEGSNVFILQSDDALTIADIMMGGNEQNHLLTEMDEIAMSAVSEAMNQMVGYSATSLSELFHRTIEISPPQLKVIEANDDAGQLGKSLDDQLIIISFAFQIGDLFESQIMLVMPLDIAKKHANYLLEDSKANADDAMVTSQAVQPDAMAVNQAAPPEAAAGHYAVRPDTPSAVQQNLGDSDEVIYYNQGNLNLILDVPLHLSVILGRTKRSIADILKFTHGSIIELERFENEPVDILVNEKLIARGQVVVVKEYFGVRITDIISAESRVRNLVQKGS